MTRLGKPILFASPEECERAFYEALAQGDAEAMGDLWLQDEDVCCVHPGSPRIVGYGAVRASWASILAGGGTQVQTLARRSFESPTLAVTHLIEEIAVVQGARSRLVHVLACNAFAKGPGGWKMVMHTGVAAPEGQSIDVEAPSGTVH